MGRRGEGGGQPVHANRLITTDKNNICVVWTGSGPLELLLGAEGEYVREIIIDELAKGIDAAVRLNLNNLLTSTRSRLLRFAGVSPNCPAVTVLTHCICLPVHLLYCCLVHLVDLSSVNMCLCVPVTPLTDRDVVLGQCCCFVTLVLCCSADTCGSDGLICADLS